jgi:hypothetical protein
MQHAFLILDYNFSEHDFNYTDMLFEVAEVLQLT